MKEKVKIVLGVFLLFSILSCTKKELEKKEMRTIVDHTGNEISIPKKIERVVIGSILPLPSVYCMFTGSSKTLVGIHPSSLAAAKNSFLWNVYPELKNCDSSFVQNGVLNVEKLLALKPDVVFYSASNVQEKTVYENAGIPAVGFAVNRSNYNSIETYADWIGLLEKIFGTSRRSREIILYGREVEKEISERISKLADNEKPRVMILFHYDDASLTVAGNNFFSEYWIEKSGGINVAKDLKSAKSVNMETIYAWNPDIIFITNFSPRLPEDLIDNTIAGTDWSLVKAVKEKKVYKFPLGMYRWFPPASDTPLVLQWLAKKLHPEVFADLDIDSEIKNYYKKFYDVELSDADLEKIYHPAREASGV